MKHADFSEFSFGFAYTYELCETWSDHLVGPPAFPNQYVEGQAGGGYDVALTTPGFVYFAQFKLATCLDHPRSGQAAKLGLPYYRFLIYGSNRSDQHELLRNLAQKQGVVVEYVAPRFHEQAELAAAWANSEVVASSRRIFPTVIGAMPDDKDHWLAYRPDGSAPCRCSEPVDLVGQLDAGPVTADGFAGFAAQEQLDDDSGGEQRPLIETVDEAFGYVAEVAGDDAVDYVNRNVDGPVERLAMLASLALGVSTFVVATD